MLNFPAPFMEDLRANQILEEHVNNQLIKMMERIARDYTPIGINGISSTDQVFCEKISYLAPTRYPKGKSAYLFLDLHAKLKDTDACTLPPAHNTMLRHIIEDEIQYRVDTDKELVIPIQDRVYLAAEFKRTLLNILDHVTIDVDKCYTIDEQSLEQEVTDFLTEFEDLENYPEFCCQTFTIAK